MLETPTHSVVFAPARSTSVVRHTFFVRLVFVAILVYLGTIGVLPLLGRDEPRYVEIGREMLESGDWITPRLGGFTWFEKPVLLYWLTALSFSVFGVSEWAARLAPALCGIGTAWMAWWMVRPTDAGRAEWSAVALLSSGGMLAFAHGATFDVLLTFCVTLSLAAWWRAQSAEAPRDLLAVFWAGVGLACLAKGLVGFVLPLGTVALYAALTRRAVKVGPWWGVPLALAVASLWYGPIIWVNGWKFVQEFFVQHHFQRFTSNKFKHHEPLWYYLEILPLLTLPWAPFLIVALWKQRGAWRSPQPDQALSTFALAWVLVPVLFFSASGSKLPGYILPSLPGACLLIGSSLRDWARGKTQNRLACALAVGSLLLAAVVSTTTPGVHRAEMSSARQLFEAAHGRSLGHFKVVNFRTISRPAQFYGAEHLVYGSDGEPLSLETPGQVREMAQIEPLLVLVRSKDYPDLTQSKLKTETLAQSGKMALVLVWGHSNAARQVNHDTPWKRSYAHNQLGSADKFSSTRPAGVYPKL